MSWIKLLGNRVTAEALSEAELDNLRLIVTRTLQAVVATDARFILAIRDSLFYFSIRFVTCCTDSRLPRPRPLCDNHEDKTFQAVPDRVFRCSDQRLFGSANLISDVKARFHFAVPRFAHRAF
jgi:hypothetical protein